MPEGKLKRTLRSISHAVLGVGGQTKKENKKKKMPTLGIIRGNYAGYRKRMAQDPDTITKMKPFNDWFTEKYPGETVPKIKK
jgi:hypothetical protein